MKLPLKIGCPNHEPYLYVGDDNTIKGVYAPLDYARHYFLYKLFNVTLIDLGPRRMEFCDEKGNCSGALHFLQTGSVDYANIFTQIQFSSIPVNLNFGPIIRESDCHLINKPKMKLDLKTENFISIVYKLDLWVIMLSFILFLVFILLTLIERYSSNILAKYSSNGRSLTLWNLYELAFGKKYLNLDINVLIGLSFVWFIFFLYLILSTLLQTGLIQSRKFLHIDTLKDILDHELTPIALSFLFCRHSILSPSSPEYQKISLRLKLVQSNNLSLASLTDDIYDSHKVLIEDLQMGYRIKGMTCILDGPVDEKSSPLYISKNSVGHLLYPFVLSSFTDPRAARLAKYAAYRVFETGNFDNKVIRKIDASSTRSQIYSECMQTKVADEKIISASLSTKNFIWIFKVLLFVEVFAIFMFLLELASKHVTKIELMIAK